MSSTRKRRATATSGDDKRRARAAAGDGAASLAARIAELDRPLLLAFDVDGTLAPIVDDPEAARAPKPLRDALARLAKVRGVRVALVTGRDARSLRKVAPVAGVWRAVEHGRRVIAPGERAQSMRLSDDERERLERFREWAEARVVPQGAALEDKPGSVAVHVRRLEARDRERARRVLQQARRRAAELDLHPREGRAVCEAEVRGGDKGDALDEVVRATGAAGVVYAGDDKTDYPAIRRAAERGGVGIFVRSKERRRAPAAASATVGGPEEIAELVNALVDALKTPARGRPGRSRSTRRGRGRRSPKR